MIFYGEDHVFVENVIKTLHKIFEIGSVNKKTFRYLGLDLQKGDSSIVIYQNNYANSIESLKLDGKKDNNGLLNETKIHNLCALIGQFNWLATQTRPAVLFECCNLLGKIESPTTDGAKRANKLVNMIKNEEIVVTLMKENNLVDSKLLVFFDDSFANMSGGDSQGGYNFLV